MKTILIYFFLFTFWIEDIFAFQLTTMTGLSLRNVSIYLLLIAWACSVFRKGRLLEPNNLNKYLIVLMFMVLASIPLKFFLIEIRNLKIIDELILFKSWTNPFLIFFILYNILEDEKACDRILFGLLALLLLTTSTMILVVFEIVPLGTIKLVKVGRSAGFSEPNQYATYLVLFIPLLLTYFLLGKNLFTIITGSVLSCIAIFALFYTGSRGGSFSFLVSLTTYLFILYRQKMIRVPSLLIAFLFLIIAATAPYMLAESEVKHSFTKRFDFRKAKDISEFTAGRTDLLLNGLRLFKESPFFGHGQNTFSSLSKQRFRIHGNSHNDYLSYLVHYGIIGLTIFLLVFVRIFQNIWLQFRVSRAPGNKKLYVSYIAGFFGYTFSMLAVNVINLRYIFWIYTALIFKYVQLDKVTQVERS